MSRNRQRITLFFCVLTAAICAVGYGQAIYLFGGDILPGDPNEPARANGEEPNDVWEPADHLVPHWDSISLTSRLYNPARHPDWDPNAPDRSLSIFAEVDIIDTNGLIGLSSSPANLLVLDQDGEVFYQSEAPALSTRFYRPPDYMRVLGPGGVRESVLQPYRLSVTIPIDPNLEDYPLYLSEAVWSTYALVTDKIETVDVPFEVTEDWFELTEGLELLVEKAVTAGTRFEYTIKARYNPAKVSYSTGIGTVHVSDHQPLAERVFLEMQMLNSDGEQVGGSGGYSGSSAGSASGSNDQMLATSSGSGSCSDCGQVATIRYRIAIQPYEKEVHFVLEDIPVPSF